MTVNMDALETLMKARRAAARNPVHEVIARLDENFAFPGAEERRSSSAAAQCLRPALAAVGWTGHERHIHEALPHFDTIEDVDGLRGVLARLNFETVPREAALEDLDAEDLPCLFTTDGKDVCVIASCNPDGTYTAFIGAVGELEDLRPDGRRGTAYRIVPHDVGETAKLIARVGYINYLLRKFRPLILNVFAVSFLINLTALVLPFFVMHVYDLGIGTKSNQVVMLLLVGGGLVIGLDVALRLVRNRAMAYFGARFDALVGTAAFQQLLYLPVHMTESAPISGQIARLKQFESLRDVFTGTLATALVDIPFIVMFLIAIAAIGGHLVWIPITLLVLYALMAAVTMPLTKLRVAASGDAKQRASDIAMEILAKRATIRDLAAETVFINRYAQEQQLFAVRNFRAQQFNGFVQNMSQTLVNVAGIGTLGLGSMWVMSGQMSSGALISAMALVWRVLSPLQSTFLSFPRLEQAISTIQQVNRLMQMKLERQPGVMPSFHRTFGGHLILNRLFMRYPSRPEPVIKGITLDIAPGKIIAITGPSGCGKSTLLKTIAGLYPLQGGAVIADGLDIRQIDPAEWRAALGVVPDQPIFFYGTIAQNMRLGCMQADDAALEQAAEDAGLWDFAHLLPERLETRLTAARLHTMPDALRQRIMLARAYCRGAVIYLLDNPANGLDPQGDAAFQKKLLSLKGKATVLFTTQRPSHMRLADHLVYMADGAVLLDGDPAAILARLPNVA